MNKTRNSIMAIRPYKSREGLWMFDDESIGLNEELFMGESDTLL